MVLENRLNITNQVELAKAREAGIIAEDAVLALIDAAMSFAIDMLQTGKRLQLVNSELAVS